jgi:hypothetical protein
LRFEVRFRDGGAGGEAVATVFAADAADARALTEDHGLDVLEVVAVPPAPTACTACRHPLDDAGAASASRPGHCARCSAALDELDASDAAAPSETHRARG